MTLVRFKNDLNPRFNSLFDTLFDTPVSEFFSDSRISRNVPALNIKETNSEFTVELAAPGMTKEDFKISLEKNQLTISSEREVEQLNEEERYIQKEFNYSSFKRSFTLPESVNQDSIKAQYENGILKISMTKYEIKEETSRLIEIS